MTAETRYHPSAEQEALADTIENAIETLLPLARLHVSKDEDDKTWAGLQELGVFGICLSDEQGGSGLGAAEEALIAMSLGRRLAGMSVFATLGAAHAVQGASKASFAGRRVAASYRHRDRLILVGQSGADLMLLRGPSDASIHELDFSELKSVDDGLWSAALYEVPKLGKGVAQIGVSQQARLRLIDAAAFAGIAQATLNMSVAYAGLRTQFGRPIGSFQAVKHHCANMAMAARCARDQTTFAAVAIDENRDDASFQAECALFVACKAALGNSGTNIQIHGGLGFSDEADPHLFLKRAQLLAAISGGLEATVERIADTTVASR